MSLTFLSTLYFTAKDSTDWINLLQFSHLVVISQFFFKEVKQLFDTISVFSMTAISGKLYELFN